MSSLTSMLTKRCESFANDSASPASSNVTSEDLVVAVFDALTGLHLPFMISGSLASNFYGVPRATQDADLVLELKLRWSKLAGRRKDFEDARNVMAVQRDRLDHDYLRRWCGELGLLDQLETLKGRLHP